VTFSLSPPKLLSVLPCLGDDFYHLGKQKQGAKVCKAESTPEKQNSVLSVPKAISLPESLCICKEDKWNDLISKLNLV